MKPLRELEATYGSRDISSLVDFARQAPIELPDGKYHFEKEGATVHIYGVDDGIREYNLGTLAQGMSLKKVRNTSTGVEIGLELGDVEKIVLHARAYQNPTSNMTTANRGRTARVRASPNAESRTASEESRSSGYRRNSRAAGESHGGGESR